MSSSYYVIRFRLLSTASSGDVQPPHHHGIIALSYGVYLICVDVMLCTKDTVKAAGLNIWANGYHNNNGPEVE